MRVAILVLDGLGVGAMDDVARSRPHDAGADTLTHVVREVGRVQMPTLERLGLGLVAPGAGSSPSDPPLASFGRCDLGYEGADSYLGHQEIMGTIARPPVPALMAQIADELETVLRDRGHGIERPWPDRPLLVVDDTVVIADNLEADVGQIVNLTFSTSEIPFDRALQVGRIVREVVEHSRVICCGGPNVRLADILEHVQDRPGGQVGIDTPGLGLYDDDYEVRHLGHGIHAERQLHTRFTQAGLPVALLGKMADLIQGEVDLRDPIVETDRLMRAFAGWLEDHDEGLIAATVQETDLAGHERDARRFASLLELVDEHLAGIVPALDPGDVLVVTADHGNDPTLPGGNHTREQVPLLWYAPSGSVRALGRRSTLADIAASIAALAGFAWDGDGISFMPSSASAATARSESRLG